MRTPRQAELPLGRPEPTQPPPAAPARRDYSLPDGYGKDLDIPASGGIPEYLKFPWETD